MTTLKDMARTVVLAKEIQVDALNRQNFSVDEYYWVHEQVYSAAELFMPEMSFRELYRIAANEGAEVEAMNDSGHVPVNERNRILVQDHKELLEDMVALAWFGL